MFAQLGDIGGVALGRHRVRTDRRGAGVESELMPSPPEYISSLPVHGMGIVSSAGRCSLAASENERVAHTRYVALNAALATVRYMTRAH